ncbi:MAG: MarR family winged helix-turn-helix transcriptional regulator [Pseudonocardiaceae bacterium]
MADAVLGPLGLTLRHFGVLSSVEAEPGQNQRVLGERLRIDRTTVVALTDDLERAGLLERRRGVDRRAFSLHLTEAGATRLAELKSMMRDVHAEFLAPLSPAEQAMLHDLLLKLIV